MTQRLYFCGKIMSRLFTSVRIGPYELSHRVVLAPLTRMRAEDGGIPGPLMAEYYGQRTSLGGFLLTEGTAATADGNGYLGSPGMYDDSQIAGWRGVTDAVHAKSGRIFSQLYHAGRQSHADLQPNGGRPAGPSEVTHTGVAFTEDGWVAATPNRALGIYEISAIVEGFRTAARRALAAGFDGVELHGANGYLFDAFLQNGSNKRTDIYGGSFENRARLLIETTRALISVWGNDRVAVRLSPSGRFGEMCDSDPTALFTYVVQELAKLNIAYLHLIEPRINGVAEDESVDQNPVATRYFRRHFPGTIIAAGGFDGDSAEAIIQAGDADLVAFGRHFAANPDLPRRIRRNLPFNPYDRSTLLGGTEFGYIDYPFFGEEAETTA
ncbi:N-ethylmaleimide reductase [Paraburkholderia sp. GAS42]